MARRLIDAVAVLGVAGIGGAGLVVGGAATPAAAATGTCATTVPAATLVAEGICEVRITTSGTFTPPSGIAKLSAVLVGGGEGALLNEPLLYGGNGGAVTYVDSVPLSAPLAVGIGAGGAPGNSATPASPGENTTLGSSVAAGGVGGPGVVCFTGAPVYGYGDGAQTAASPDPDCYPGVGYALSQLSGVDPALFPAAADGTEFYGNGGDATDADPVAVSAWAGTGGSVNSSLAAAGSPGLVILRFAAGPTPPVAPPAVGPAAAVAPTLPATGMNLPWTVPAGAAALVVLGVLLLTVRRRSDPR